MGKVKAHKVMKTINSSAITDVISSMTGDGPADLEVLITKCQLLRNTLTHIERILEIFSNFPIIGRCKAEVEEWLLLYRFSWENYPLISREVNEYDSFCSVNSINVTNKHIDAAKEIMDHLADLKKMSPSVVNDKFLESIYFRDRTKLYTKEQLVAFSHEIATLRENRAIIEYMNISKELLPLAQHLREDNFAEIPNLYFIHKIPVVNFQPFGRITKYDFKTALITDDITDIDKRGLLSILAKIFRYTLLITKINSTPDVDIDDLTEGIINGIMNLQAELPRCNNAFKAIRDSADLLKDNFNNYFLNFRATNNPMSIVEMYLSDISQQSGNSGAVIRELRKIVMHIKAKMNTMVSSGYANKVDPSGNSKIHELINMFDSVIGLKDENKNKDEAQEESSGDEDAEEAADEAEETPKKSKSAKRRERRKRAQQFKKNSNSVELAAEQVNEELDEIADDESEKSDN